MSITVTKQGMFDTLQDFGRHGYQHLGINPGGVMDTFSASVANLLVGNEVSEAVIELHFPASFFYFDKPCLIALSGANFGARINNEPIPLNTAIIVAVSSTLEFNRLQYGARCYLAIQGGWDADCWLGSYSTDVKLAAGGFRKPLQKNDVLHCRSSLLSFNGLMPGTSILSSVQVSLETQPVNSIRYFKGHEFNWLDDASARLLTTTDFEISVKSDRMGYRLQGSPLKAKGEQMISAAVSKGTVQLLPDGQLIVLMAAHQTTGGYPRIAQVVATDIDVLAQRQMKTQIRFEEVSIEKAELLCLQQQQYLQDIAATCTFQLKQLLSAYDFNRS